MAITAPPGLEAMTGVHPALRAGASCQAKDMEPQKVAVSASTWLEDGVKQLATACSSRELLGADAWVKAVQGVIPRLNSNGLTCALKILDHAMANVQQAKHIEEALEGKQVTTSFEFVVAANLAKMRITEKQCRLLAALGELPLAAHTGGKIKTCLKKTSGLPQGTPSEELPGSTIASAGSQQSDGTKPGGRQVLTLSRTLGALPQEDPEYQPTARRSRTLRVTFSECSKTAQAPRASHKQGGRQCPSSLGFAQVASPAVKDAVLAQKVKDVTILMQKFQRQRAANNCDDVDKELAECVCDQASTAASSDDQRGADSSADSDGQ